jgi:uncharacterized protein (DUF2141 family)
MRVNYFRTWTGPFLWGSFLWGVSVSLMGTPISATPSALTVNLSGIRSQEGNVIVCLWREQDENFPVCSTSSAFQRTTVAADSSSVTVTFRDVPSGEYAITAVHDQDKDGKLDRGFMGRPEEGIALSNMTQERERPSFDRAKFTLEGENTITLSFMYF